MPIVIKRRPAAAPPPPPPAPEPRDPPPPTQTTRPWVALTRAIGSDLFDREALQALRGPGAISWWLMASYAYYLHDTPIITDAAFDALTAQIRAERASLTHPHAHLITDAMLDAGTGFNLSLADYPELTRTAAARLMLRLQERASSRN